MVSLFYIKLKYLADFHNMLDVFLKYVTPVRNILPNVKTYYHFIKATY